MREVENPRIYGVVEFGDKIYGRVHQVVNIVEKPKEPPSNYAVMPIYIFKPVIMHALREVKPGPKGEIELTDAIGKLVEWGLKVYCILIDRRDVWLDIGTPENYWQALKLSYSFNKRR